MLLLLSLIRSPLLSAFPTAPSHVEKIKQDTRARVDILSQGGKTSCLRVPMGGYPPPPQHLISSQNWNSDGSITRRDYYTEEKACNWPRVAETVSPANLEGGCTELQQFEIIMCGQLFHMV